MFLSSTALDWTLSCNLERTQLCGGLSENVAPQNFMVTRPGKRLHNYGKNHHFLRENQLFRLGHFQ